MVKQTRISLSRSQNLDFARLFLMFIPKKYPTGYAVFVSLNYTHSILGSINLDMKIDHVQCEILCDDVALVEHQEKSEPMAGDKKAKSCYIISEEGKVHLQYTN